MVEDVVGCKWSLCVLDLVSRGINRPGAMQRSVVGLSTKVLNERLRKLVRFGVLERQAFAEVPPRVEYHLTDLGVRFRGLLDAIEELERDFPRRALAAKPLRRRG
ncbi:MAG: helix-turn-helix domain-containing protein [Steroidobacteraceae bacterium]